MAIISNQYNDYDTDIIYCIQLVKNPFPFLLNYIYNRYKGQNMQIQGMQGMKWKGLAGSKTDRSFADSRSKSKNKKYAPTRSGLVSELNQKIKLGNESNINNSYNQSVGKEKQASYIERESISKNTDGGEYREKYSPTKSEDSLRFDLRSKIRPVMSINQELASPTVIMKQLNKLKKVEIQGAQNPPSRALFSLDQQHQYIHQQLYKIKIEYKKFKQLVHQELTKQLVYVKAIVSKIYSQFQKIIQTCTKCSEGFHYAGTNLDYQENSFENVGMSSPEMSAIQKISSFNQSRTDIKKLLEEQSIKLGRAIGHKMSQNHSQQKNINIGRKQSDTIPNLGNVNRKTTNTELKSDFNSLQKNQNQSLKEPNNGLGRKSSKKQFQKLFQAVNCLKNDIKDLKGLSNTIKKDDKGENKPNENQNNLVGSQSRGKAKTIANLKIDITKETLRKNK